MTAKPLRDVAAKIQEMYSGNDLSNEYIFDQTAHDTIILNRELHKTVLRERNPPTSFTQAEIPYFGPQIPDPDYDCFIPTHAKVLKKTESDNDSSINETNYHQIQNPEHSTLKHETTHMTRSDISQPQRNIYVHELPDYEYDYVPPTLLFYGPLNGED